MTFNTRHDMRRDEDKSVASALDVISGFLQRWRILAFAVVFVVSVAAAGSAWLGAQNAIPKRLTTLESRVDTIMREHVGIFESRKDLGDKIELLLRLNCPSVQRSDLLKACQPYTVPNNGFR